MEGRVVQSTAMADEEKNIVGKRSKKSIPLSHTNGEIRRTVTKTAKTRNYTTHMDTARLSSIHPPTTAHDTHMYDDGDDTHNSVITHQALIKISHSPSKRLHSDFFLLFLFLIENENRVFSFEVGKVNVTLRIKRS